MFRCERRYITFVFPQVADVYRYLEQLTELFRILNFAYVINVVTVITWLG